MKSTNHTVSVCVSAWLPASTLMALLPSPSSPSSLLPFSPSPLPPFLPSPLPPSSSSLSLSRLFVAVQVWESVSPSNHACV